MIKLLWNRYIRSLATHKHTRPGTHARTSYVCSLNGSVIFNALLNGSIYRIIQKNRLTSQSQIAKKSFLLFCFAKNATFSSFHMTQSFTRKTKRREGDGFYCSLCTKKNLQFRARCEYSKSAHSKKSYKNTKRNKTTEEKENQHSILVALLKMDRFFFCFGSLVSFLFFRLPRQ